jgi:hypothetical protein
MFFGPSACHIVVPDQGWHVQAEERLQILKREKRHNDVSLLEDHMALVYAAMAWQKPPAEVDVATLASSYTTLCKAMAPFHNSHSVF